MISLSSIIRRINSHYSNTENYREYKLVGPSYLELPDDWHWKEQDNKVKDHVEDSNSATHCIAIHAFARLIGRPDLGYRVASVQEGKE